jgi:hypothetical protein
VDGVSMILTNSDPKIFKKDINNIVLLINTWFQSNLLSLNLDKTHLLQFLTKNSQEIDLQVTYDDKQITKICNIKFLGLMSGKKFSWGLHIDEIVTKLNRAEMIRTLKSFLSLEALRMIYFCSVHAILSYGIIFGVVHLIVKLYLK